MVPQAATCVLAATMLVTVPAGGNAALADTPPPYAQRQPAQQRPTIAQRLKIDAGTMRRVRAYTKYRRKLARQESRARTAIRFARDQIGKPYRWGATGPSAYDCSGLVMKAWRRAGVRIPRVTHSQYRAVRRKVSLSSLRPGDLIFFNGRQHVGMYLSGDRYVHAPNSGSRIRINKMSRYRKRQFAGAVRPGAPAPREWPESIPRLSRQVEELKKQDQREDRQEEQEEQEAAAHPDAPAPSGQHPASSERNAPAGNPPVTSPQNEAPPGPSQSRREQAPPGSTAPEQGTPAATASGRDPEESG
jgi:cell wall-associated NlpC family hydrolase